MYQRFINLICPSGIQKNNERKMCTFNKIQAVSQFTSLITCEIHLNNEFYELQ